MRLKWPADMSIAVAIGVYGVLFSTPTWALLVDRGGGLIYDTIADVTYLSDASLANGTPFDNGASSSDGYMTWQNAHDWADQLEHVDNVRSINWTDWRMPATPVGGCTRFNCTDSDFGNLFYTNFGGQATTAISAQHNTNYDLFSNIDDGHFWSSIYQENAAYQFDFSSGLTSVSYTDTTTLRAWAVRAGDVGTVDSESSVVDSTTTALDFHGAAGGDAGGVNIQFAEGAISDGAVVKVDNYNLTEEGFEQKYSGTDGLPDLSVFDIKGLTQTWEIGVTSGDLLDEITLDFFYDDSALTELEESLLGIWHYGKYGAGDAREWRFFGPGNPDFAIDTINDKITVVVDNLSPFSLGTAGGNLTVSLPTSLALVALGIAGVGGARRFRHR